MYQVTLYLCLCVGIKTSIGPCTIPRKMLLMVSHLDPFHKMGPSSEEKGSGTLCIQRLVKGCRTLRHDYR